MNKTLIVNIVVTITLVFAIANIDSIYAAVKGHVEDGISRINVEHESVDGDVYTGFGVLMKTL